MINYCTNCGHQTQYQQQIDDPIKRAVCSNCHKVHYENPKIITGIVPIWKNQILLCKRAIDPQKEKWTVPAGFMELHESAEEGALREAKEEANIDAKIDYLLAVYSLKKVSQVYLIYVAQVQNNQFKPMPETQEIALYNEKTIPWPDIAFTSVTFTLKAYYQNQKNKETKTHREKS